MIKLYKWFGGRKIFFFLSLLIMNTLILLSTDKWTDGFGWFTVGLYATIVVGVEGERFIKGKGEKNGD